MTHFIYVLLLLCAGHALCDYSLQNDFIAKGKNHKTPFPGMASWQILLAHCFVHMGMVLLITGSIWLALAELVIHYITDWSKCDGRISFNTDQAIHYSCKLLWAILITIAFLYAPSSSTPKLAEHQPQAAGHSLPAHLDINGETWDVVPVDRFDDATMDASTDCENREIDYIPSSDSAKLHESLWHEVFHAGACIHGGDDWWNSVHPTDDEHPGIYHLADFLHNFTHDNQQFVRWAEED